jgi:hypothetical protein
LPFDTAPMSSGAPESFIEAAPVPEVAAAE